MAEYVLYNTSRTYVWTQEGESQSLSGIKQSDKGRDTQQYAVLQWRAGLQRIQADITHD